MTKEEKIAFAKETVKKLDEIYFYFEGKTDREDEDLFRAISNRLGTLASNIEVLIDWFKEGKDLSNYV